MTGFLTPETDLDRNNVIQHIITTGNSLPIRQGSRRVPIAKFPEVEHLLQKMKTKKVIEPSSSPWLLPVVLVAKKDGSTRFYVDQRKLNSLKDSYRPPKIDGTLDALGGSRCF